MSPVETKTRETLEAGRQNSKKAKFLIFKKLNSSEHEIQ